MKFFVGLLCLAVTLSGIFALPARSPSDDAEVISVPRRRTDSSDEDPDFRDFKGVIDTGAGYPFLQSNPHAFSFNLGFFDSFEDIFRRLRSRLWPVVAIPGDDSSSGSNESNDSGTGVIGFPSLDLNPKNGNTTSTVKVVDGHKVEVNETVYGDNNNIFKVRVVNIRPLEEGETVEESNISSTGTTTKNEDGDAKQKPNPVTSAPTNRNEEVDDDSEERREPLEKKAAENEIQGDIDGPEHETTTTTTETAQIIAEADEKEPIDEEEANLASNQDQIILHTIKREGTVPFVTGNHTEEQQQQQTEQEEVQPQHESAEESGNGYVEAETNRPTTAVEMENGDGIALYETHGQTGPSHLLANDGLTIENNEETEVNDNFNESSSSAKAAAAETVEVPDVDVDTEADAADDAAEAIATLENFDDAAVADGEQTHSNYANKHREDVVSSSDDDEDNEHGSDVFEMNPTFHSEWESLSDDLAKARQEQNDLNNDIDVYDSVPIDLSNDIAVNDAAAANPDFPLNPDAEFIDVFEPSVQSAGGAGASASASDGAGDAVSMPKFEKLSLSSAMNPTSYQPAASYLPQMK